MPATIIRSTTGWLFTVDRAVRDMGHESCGGWQLTHTESVVCACGGVLFHLAEVVSR